MANFMRRCDVEPLRTCRSSRRGSVPVAPKRHPTHGEKGAPRIDVLDDRRPGDGPHPRATKLGLAATGSTSLGRAICQSSRGTSRPGGRRRGALADNCVNALCCVGGVDVLRDRGDARRRRRMRRAVWVCPQMYADSDEFFDMDGAELLRRVEAYGGFARGPHGRPHRAGLDAPEPTTVSVKYGTPTRGAVP